MDLFAQVSSAAHEGAFGLNSRSEPSLAQLRAGNYAKGRVRLHGFRIAIETPQGQRRTGKSDGQPWSVICQAHYGYFEQVKGADGDELDVFIGPWPESLMAYVVNRVSASGQFDEHKVLLGFPDRASALNAYQNSYESGHSGMGSVVACTLDQLRWWMKYGDLTRPLTVQQLPFDGNLLMSETLWDSTAQPVGSSPALLMYALRRSDADLLLLDSVMVADVLEDSDGEVMLDALVVPLNDLSRKVGQIQAVMRAAGKEVKPVALQVTPPFKQKGTTQVAAIIEMSDGQTVTIFFHNPDATPNQLTPDDEMVSWKWLLNKRDVTLVVAPEKGQDLNPREVGRRIMRLVEANSGKFQAANLKRSERMANIEQMKASIQDKEAELAQVLKEIADIKAGNPSASDQPSKILPEGRANTVKTARGTKVETGFTVVEADRLIVSHDRDGNPNPNYPAELQPRDRSRTTSQAWVQKTAKTLDPDSLGRTSRADSGAPIIGTDRVVESGNGRTMAIIEAYRQGTAEEYRAWLLEEAEHLGLDPERIRAMKAPVLVRVRTSDVDRRSFAVEANQDDKLAMTGTEKAKADADRLNMALLSKLGAEGDLLAAGNRDFVKGFLASLGDAEAAQYITSTGQPTGALIARIQAAIFAKAYSDDRLLELTADSSKPEVANIIEALNLSAPDFILAQAADAQGTQALASKLVDSVEVSLNQQAVEAIIEATNLVRKARAEGTSVEEAVSQLGLFGDIPPATAAMALFINKNNRSSKRLGAAFKAMAQFVRQEAVRGQSVDLFGDDASKTGLQQVIEAANRQLEKEYGEGAYAIEVDDLLAPLQSEPITAKQAEPEVGPFGPVLTQYRHDAQGAIAALMSLRDGEAVAALHHPDVGDIDLVWGNADGFGLAKIAVKHPEVMGDLQGFLSRLHKDTEKSGKNRIRLVDDGGNAVVSLDWKGERKVWLLTAFEKKAGAATRMDTDSDELKGGTARLEPGFDQSVSEGETTQQESKDDLNNNPDAAFLQTVIDGTVEDILAPELGDQIAAIYERHAEDPQMLVLIEQAVMAYEKAMLAATAHYF